MDRELIVRRAAVRRVDDVPLVYSWDLACAVSGDLDELLVRLLTEEAQKQCDQCGAGDCTHQAAEIVLLERAEFRSYSWDSACEQGYSYQGYGLDELLRLLLVQKARRWCGQCRNGCVHSAARTVVEEIVGAEEKVVDTPATEEK